MRIYIGRRRERTLNVLTDASESDVRCAVLLPCGASVDETSVTTGHGGMERRQYVRHIMWLVSSNPESREETKGYLLALLARGGLEA